MKLITAIAVLMLSISAHAFTKKELGEAYNKIGKASKHESTVAKSLDVVVELANTMNAQLSFTTDEYIKMLQLMDQDSSAHSMVSQILNSQLASNAFMMMAETVAALLEVRKINKENGPKMTRMVYGTIIAGAESDGDFLSAISVYIDLAKIHLDFSYPLGTYVKDDADVVRAAFKQIYELP